MALLVLAKVLVKRKIAITLKDNTMVEKDGERERERERASGGSFWEEKM